MSISFTTSISPPSTTEPCLWFIFKGFRLLVIRRETDAAIPRFSLPDDAGLWVERRVYLGTLDYDTGSIHCYCGEVSESTEAPNGYVFENLRPLYSLLDEDSFRLAGRAVQIVDWDRTSRFCGRCGHETVVQTIDRSKICPECRLTDYPRLSPAIIVRVTKQTERGPEILLARAQRFPTAMFSVLAGFVEPGETLEECVAREIGEEVGIKVRNIQYFGSQPWPFPHSLMIAFTADHDSGELCLDPVELAEAAWFTPQALPVIPSPPSIANKLIQDFIAQAALDKRSNAVSG